jgi:signal transduction histidine kinase
VRFEQVVTNLVENALKYSPGTTPVSVRVWCEDGEARLSVQDHGIGIPHADLPLVFDRFYRARNVDDRSFAGMGLGLYIARGIVEQHGGRIWVETTPGQGSVFFVAVPNYVIDETAAMSEPVPEGGVA